MYINLILIPLFFLLMLGDIKGRKTENDKLVSICQPGTTLVVLAIALTGFLRPGHQTWYIIPIAGGLGLSALADALLVDRSDPKGFIKGMGLFMFAILIYGITWTVHSGWHTDDYMVMFLMLSFYLVLIFIFRKGQYTDDRKPSKIENIGITVYLFVFSMVISRALATFGGDYFSGWQSAFMSFGIISFFLGDCQLGIYHFINLKFPMLQAPPFYFIGQLFIGLSCLVF